MGIDIHPGGFKDTKIKTIKNEGIIVETFDYCENCVKEIIQKTRHTPLKKYFPIINCEFQANFYLGFLQFKSNQVIIATFITCAIIISINDILYIYIYIIIITILLIYNRYYNKSKLQTCKHKRC